MAGFELLGMRILQLPLLFENQESLQHSGSILDDQFFDDFC
jgi:hypothetical protein